MPFDSLEKLLTTTNYEVAVQSESTQESNFELSSDPIKQKIYAERLQTYKSISAEIPLIYPNNVLYALRKEIS